MCYDTAGPIPLANDTVAQILCEHVLEHVRATELPSLLAEFHRVLKPGGWARVAVPDYGHPKHAALMEEGLRLGRPDRTNPRHVTFTHYAMLRDLAFASPFGGAVFYEFWDGAKDAARHAALPMSFDQGLVKRSVLHDERHRRSGGRPRPSRATSVVFDLVKRDAAGDSRENIPRADHMLRYYEHPSFKDKRREAYLRAERKKRSRLAAGGLSRPADQERTRRAGTGTQSAQIAGSSEAEHAAS